MQSIKISVLNKEYSIQCDEESVEILKSLAQKMDINAKALMKASNTDRDAIIMLAGIITSYNVDQQSNKKNLVIKETLNMILSKLMKLEKAINS